MMMDIVKDEALMEGDATAAAAQKTLAADYPLLEGLRNRVNNQRGIKKWLETRPNTPM